MPRDQVLSWRRRPPVRVRAGEFARRSGYRPFRMDVQKFIQTIKDGWYADVVRRDRSAIELFQGRPYVLNQGFSTSAILDRIYEILCEVVPEDGLLVLRGNRWVFCDAHNFLSPALIVSGCGDKIGMAAADAALIVDVATRSNHRRILAGRETYLAAGLRNHWLIDPVAGHLEVVSTAGKTRFEAGGTVPVGIDGVVYGKFALDDLFTA